jgi:MerR family transcriptional regulator, light-induced transcriptional regulator
MATIDEFSQEPRYVINVVAERTGIQAVTIRAWERRYNLVQPERAANGYRMYSERDVAVLLWASSRVESGVSISTVVQEFRLAVKGDRWPEVPVTSRAPMLVKTSAKRAANAAVAQLVQSMVRHDEKMAAMIFEETLGSFTMLEFFESVLAPVMVEIGERWARGEISVTTEHFASNIILARLQAIFQALPLHSNAPRVMVGCSPTELHIIGPLMLSILLRDAGYRVEFLGPDVPLDDLIAYICDETPKLVILSATLQESAGELVAFPKMLRQCKNPPLFGFGGSAFGYDPTLIAKIDGKFMGPSLTVLGNYPADSATQDCQENPYYLIY